MLRKKRVTISEQAQAAIATGMPVDQALAEHGVSDPVEATSDTIDTDPTDTVTDAPPVESEASSDVDGDAGSEGVTEGDDSDESSSAPAAAAASDFTVSALLDRLQTAQNTIAAQASQITSLTEKAETAVAAQEALMGVCVEAVNRMQIGLGGAATDLSGLSAENLLAQYRSTLTLMQQRFPVGGKAEVPVDDGSHADGKVVPLVSPAVARATQIRK